VPDFQLLRLLACSHSARLRNALTKLQRSVAQQWPGSSHQVAVRLHSRSAPLLLQNVLQWCGRVTAIAALKTSTSAAQLRWNSSRPWRSTDLQAHPEHPECCRCSNQAVNLTGTPAVAAELVGALRACQGQHSPQAHLESAESMSETPRVLLPALVLTLHSTEQLLVLQRP
jgi:hypothetical protein